MVTAGFHAYRSTFTSSLRNSSKLGEGEFSIGTLVQIQHIYDAHLHPHPHCCFAELDEQSACSCVL